MLNTKSIPGRSSASGVIALLTLGFVSRLAVTNPFITVTFSCDYSSSDKDCGQRCALYGAPGVRSWSTNPGTSPPCGGGTPNAYFSVNGGTTNLSNYNNCSNGGDYDDWANNADVQVQDPFGDRTAGPLMPLTLNEVTLLEAVGYDFAAPTSFITVPKPATPGILLFGMAILRCFKRNRPVWSERQPWGVLRSALDRDQRQGWQRSDSLRVCFAHSPRT